MATIDGEYTTKYKTGRCHRCNIRWAWQGKLKLKDAYCPICGAKLRLTTHLFKAGPTYIADVDIRTSDELKYTAYQTEEQINKPVIRHLSKMTVEKIGGGRASSN